MRRRDLLWLGTAGLALDALGTGGRGELRQRPDLAGYRQTFTAEFDDPKAPLSIHDGGPFTTRYEQWGGLRTLPGTHEQELFVDKAFVPAPGGTDEAGHADAPAGMGEPLGYDPFDIRDGCLNITAIPVNPAQRNRVDRAYLSGLISTEWSFTQRFGYFEIRAQLPPGRGLWPAFWMVSKTSAEHLEIDVFEAIGQVDRVYHSVKMAARHAGFHVASAYRPGFDYSDGMHTYGALWTEKELIFFIDETESARTDATPLRDAPPMYLIACMAIGGTWPGMPTAATHFPATMRIDYIRAYQRLA
jgi:hypothetical protein